MFSHAALSAAAGWAAYETGAEWEEAALRSSERANPTNRPNHQCLAGFQAADASTRQPISFFMAELGVQLIKLQHGLGCTQIEIYYFRSKFDSAF
jgi:hypothetical protein